MKADELYTLATWEMARGTEKNVPGMKGFSAFFMKSLPLKSRKLVVAFEKQREKALDDFLKKSEAEGWGKPNEEKKPG